MPEPQPAAPPQRTGQPTIYDVAQACGVSPSTVSRAFSRPGRVRADTTERIRHVAQELGYRLPLARPCATSRSTGLVALVIPEVSNPFYLEIVHGAEAAAEARGYGLVLTATRGCRRPEREVIAAVSERSTGCCWP